MKDSSSSDCLWLEQYMGRIVLINTCGGLPGGNSGLGRAVPCRIPLFAKKKGWRIDEA